jgi:DNA modification methylase
MDYELYCGDCLEVMANIVEGSIDAIITDPPYGTIKGTNLDGWNNQKKIKWDNALNPIDIFEKANRVLRTNGALILFSQEPYTSKLITEAHGNLPFSYRLIWLKDHFANALVAKKAPVSYYEDIIVFFKKYDTLAQHPLRKYAKSIMDYCGRNLKQINNDLGHRRAEHFFYIDSTQFKLCTEKTYDEITSKYNLELMNGFKNYKELLEVDKQRYNKRFNLPKGKKFKGNVLKYKKDYGGLHPTQKPVALMEDLIETFTNPNDIVLDFTMGSGSTGVAALNTGRFFIGIEKDDHYFEVAKKRIEDLK